MVRSQGRLAEVLGFAPEEQHVYSLRATPTLRSYGVPYLLWSEGYKHVAPPEQSPGALGLTLHSPAHKVRIRGSSPKSLRPRHHPHLRS